MKNIKVQILADKLMALMPIIDGLMESMDSEDFELLEETREYIERKINYGNSAIPVIMALGGNYDDTEDRMKAKTLDSLIELIKVRKEYKEELLKKQDEHKKIQENINIFKKLGLY